MQCSNDSGTSIDTELKSEQKISETRGNFDGNLSLGDEFGSAVTSIGDLEADGVTDLAVGAPFDDDDGTDRGALWILFMDSDGKVDTEQKISSRDGDFDGNLDNNDRFASAVVAIGDLNGDGFLDLAVGAPGDDDGRDDQGAVWILFLNADGTVLQTQKISAEAGDFGGELDRDDQFGSAVANIGDLDGDGVTDLAVSAVNDDDGPSNAGAVWILFMNTDGTVKTEQKISEQEGGFGGNLSLDDGFGSAVAGIGDLDDNGVADLAVGVGGDDNGGINAGAVWILFLKQDGTVDSEQKISQTRGKFEGTLNSGDRFGSAIAVMGDLDSDDTVDLAVGAPGTDDGGLNRGAVWILFMEDSGDVGTEIKISGTSGNFDGTLGDGDRFGSAVAGIGDLDDDGANDIAAGAPGDNDGGISKGALWILFMDRVKKEIEVLKTIF